MRIFGISLVKNEGDIIEFNLTEALKWCDRIFVFDNGSMDDTWEKVQAFAKKDERVVPFVRRKCPYRDDLRAEVFQAFRTEANEGDWWCRYLDADEFYVDNPRDFLSKLPESHQVVWTIHFQYYLTQAESEKLLPVENIPLHTSFETLPRYYKSNHSEARFFRYRKGLIWEKKSSSPRHMGLVATRRIRLKHFQYRSPGQTQLRLDTRRQAFLDGHYDFSHSIQEHWHEKLVDANRLHYDDFKKELVVDKELLPNHLEKPWVRVLKRCFHGLGIWK